MSSPDSGDQLANERATSDHDDRSTASFLRGLTLGALIGAIIAGSSIWSRRRRARLETHLRADLPALQEPAQREQR